MDATPHNHSSVNHESEQGLSADERSSVASPLPALARSPPWCPDAGKTKATHFPQFKAMWTAMALKHVVFANPDSVHGKNLLADSYEQLGYQAESGPWRSEYLQGAYELRNGVPKAGGTDTASPDTIKAMPPEMLFDYLGVRLNGPKAAGKNITLNIKFTDLNKEYGLTVENAVLHYAPQPVPNANANLTLTKATLDEIRLGNITLDDARKQNKLTIDGQEQSFNEFIGLLDNFPFWFNIVTP